MNERIQQMIYNLNEKVGVHWTNEDKLKFADLIVRECAKVCNSRVGNSDYNTSRMHCASDIKEHFGVEE